VKNPQIWLVSSIQGELRSNLTGEIKANMINSI
jgi:hypothetical protein